MVNWICVRSQLSIPSTYELPSISIDFVFAFPQAEFDVDVFMEITLGMVVHINRVERFLNLNQSLYGLNKTSAE